MQLHNLKLQEALVGLNVRNNTQAGAPDPVSGKLRDNAANKEANSACASSPGPCWCSGCFPFPPEFFGVNRREVYEL